MDIDAIKNSVTQELGNVSSNADLDALRVRYLGRKGVLADLTGSIPSQIGRASCRERVSVVV